MPTNLSNRSVDSYIGFFTYFKILNHGKYIIMISIVFFCSFTTVIYNLTEKDYIVRSRIIIYTQVYDLKFLSSYFFKAVEQGWKVDLANSNLYLDTQKPQDVAYYSDQLVLLEKQINQLILDDAKRQDLIIENQLQAPLLATEIIGEAALNSKRIIRESAITGSRTLSFTKPSLRRVTPTFQVIILVSIFAGFALGSTIVLLRSSHNRHES